METSEYTDEIEEELYLEESGLIDKPQISTTDTFLMLSVAFMIDAIQAVLLYFGIGLIINRGIAIIAWLTFYIWFKIKNVNFITARRILSLNGAGVIEMIPGAGGILPGWTFGVFSIILSVKTGFRVPKLSRR